MEREKDNLGVSESQLYFPFQFPTLLLLSKDWCDMIEIEIESMRREMRKNPLWCFPRPKKSATQQREVRNSTMNLATEQRELEVRNTATWNVNLATQQR